MNKVHGHLVPAHLSYYIAETDGHLFYTASRSSTTQVTTTWSSLGHLGVLQVALPGDVLVDAADGLPRQAPLLVPRQQVRDRPLQLRREPVPSHRFTNTLTTSEVLCNHHGAHHP
jgi:hypothetical protein